ncbi:MAG: hypothetical protein ACRBBW_20945 [Cellvibrionaceae bacterium]
MKRTLFFFLALNSGIATAYESQFEHCNALIRHGMQDVKTKYSLDTADGYNYHQYCRTSSSSMSDSSLSKATASLFGFGSGSGGYNRARASAMLDSFCETNQRLESSSSELYAKASKYSGPALEAWNQCQEAARKMVQIKLSHRSENSTKLTFTIDSTQNGTLYLTGIEHTAYTCELYKNNSTTKDIVSPLASPLVSNDNNRTIHKYDNVPINNANIHIGCHRNDASVASGNEIKKLKYEEGAISIYTTGPSFSISIPEVVEDYYHTPKNSVLAFALNPMDKCPSGWSLYKEAYGRFIRGIDPTGSTTIDPEGVRAHGSHQEDAFKLHTHDANMEIGAEPFGEKAKAAEAAGAHGSIGEMYTSKGLVQGRGDVNETRPKNVALLYCIKN